MKLNPSLKSFWKTKAQIRVLYGGRMSSKTMDTAGILIYLASKYKIRVACLRRYQNKLSESVYSVLKRLIQEDDRFKDMFEFTNSSIKCSNGSEFVFLGIQRGIDEIKGLDNITITWIEEAEQVSKEQWDIIRPTVLREENSFCVFVFNPKFVTDYVYKEFIINQSDNVLVRKINYNENPFITQSALDLIESDRKNFSEDDFNNIYLGFPKQDDDEAIIKRSWIEAAVDAHKYLNIEIVGAEKIGYDVADSGEDTCATIKTKGILAYKCEEWKAKEDELEESAERVYKSAKLTNSIIVYDSIGVGASAGSTFKRLNKPQKVKLKYSGFNAGEKVLNPDAKYKNTDKKNKDFFANVKAQSWWELAERFKNTYNAVTKGTPFKKDEIISLSSDLKHLDRLKEELSTPRKDEDLIGRVKVESKKDLKKRGIPSPNCFIAGTKVLTPKGNRNIEDLNVGDFVLTPMGKSEIIHTHKNRANNIISNRGLTGTSEHKIFTWNKGWVSLQMLSLCDIIEYSKIRLLKWQIMNLLYTEAKCSQFSHTVNTIVQEDTGERMLEMKDFYTGGFGLRHMAKFLTIITSTTLMIIGEIMKLKTWSALKQQNIVECTCLKDLKIKITKKKIESNLQLLRIKLKNGINQKRGLNGIENMQENYLKKENIKSTSVKFVGTSLNQEELTSPLHVQSFAQTREQTKEQKSYANQNVGSAEKHLAIQPSREEINTKDVLESVPFQSKGIVYNITLKEHNVFYANGILVKNCADALVMSYAKPKSNSLMEAMLADDN